jgi:hypothetical protein
MSIFDVDMLEIKEQTITTMDNYEPGLQYASYPRWLGTDWIVGAGLEILHSSASYLVCPCKIQGSYPVYISVVSRVAK